MPAGGPQSVTSPTDRQPDQQQSARPLRAVRAATAAEAAALRSPAQPVQLHPAAVAMGGEAGSYPTDVARNAGVADGPWSSVDATLVGEATANDTPALKTRRTKRFAEHGGHFTMIRTRTGQSETSTSRPTCPLQISRCCRARSYECGKPCGSLALALALALAVRSSFLAFYACEVAVDSGSLLTAGTVLLGASAEELAALAKEAGQSAYRGKQLSDSIRNGARTLQDIHNARLMSSTYTSIHIHFIQYSPFTYCWQLLVLS